MVSAAGSRGVWISLMEDRDLRVCRSAITGMTYVYTVVKVENLYQTVHLKCKLVIKFIHVYITWQR